MVCMGGHRSGGNKGNGWEFVDRVMGETMTGSGMVGSVGAGDVSAKGVGGPVVRVVEVPLRH